MLGEIGLLTPKENQRTCLIAKTILSLQEYEKGTFSIRKSFEGHAFEN